MVENCLAGFNNSVFAYGQVLASSFSFILIFELLLNWFMTFQIVCRNKMIFTRPEVERLIRFGVQPTPCWKKIYQVINKA